MQALQVRGQCQAHHRQMQTRLARASHRLVPSPHGRDQHQLLAVVLPAVQRQRGKRQEKRQERKRRSVRKRKSRRRSERTRRRSAQSNASGKRGSVRSASYERHARRERERRKRRGKRTREPGRQRKEWALDLLHQQRDGISNRLQRRKQRKTPTRTGRTTSPRLRSPAVLPQCTRAHTLLRSQRPVQRHHRPIVDPTTPKTLTRLF